MQQDTGKYGLTREGTFVIRDYHKARPFSNFFPGIAGIWGVPMWVFYVNRGQGIACFGIESKDKAIVEFQPANKAYRLTASHGFRTFLKVKKGGTEKFYEPFRSPATSPFKISQAMKISSHDLTIEETNTTLGIEVIVNYFTLPEEPFSGLVRRVTVRNIGRAAQSIQMIDGLPAIIPYGQNDWVMKNMCRTIEAWYKVRNLGHKAPYFQLDVEAADVPQVQHIQEGNFYFAFDAQAKPGTLLDAVVEPSLVFGAATDWNAPEQFIAGKNFTIPQGQQTGNRTPCAFSFVRFSLNARASKEIVSMTGFARTVADLKSCVKKTTRRGFIAQKAERNRMIIEEIKSMAFTRSAQPAFDAYAGQTFLDNVIRGGLPISLQTSEGPAVVNVYSRKHGDLERDYNAFRLSPTFLSQGNGNYRDVNQNRRQDVWFNQDLKENAVVNFFSLLQADGYNPLVVCGMTFVCEDGDRVEALAERSFKAGDVEAFKDFCRKGFMPGDVFNFIADQNIQLKKKTHEFLSDLLGICHKSETAQHGEGFWVDHWTYNLDLVESYLALYPESLQRILLEDKSFTFYYNSTCVRPRDERYILTSRGVRQYNSLYEGRMDKDRGHKLRVRHGQGEVYQATLLVKILSLLANKAATLDPSGIGIDMEANKPGWYDSLNGLPGLLGSSICETFELKRFALFILDALDKLAVAGSDTVSVYEELFLFVNELKDILGKEIPDLEYWKKSNMIKEEYREKVRHGVSGVEREIPFSDVRLFLEAVVTKVDQGVKKALDREGLFPTYCYHKVTKFEKVDGVPQSKEGPHVRPLEFERYDLPLFLEGFVHALRCEKDPEKALTLHQKVRRSALYDKILKMYKNNADISRETEEIGRARVFPRGWLENESVWLHMEYKYLLELLRLGLFEEFYQDLDTCCVAFMPPERYGRSILENSSFIVSSAHEDKTLHGQGNVARLSGSTAEFVHMWMYMNAGRAPFSVNGRKGLELSFRPALKGAFFTKEKTSGVYVQGGREVRMDFPAGTYAFRFMGRTLVVYHNPDRKDTFGPGGAGVSRYELFYGASLRPVSISGSVIPAPHAEDVRCGKVARVNVYMD